MTDTNRTEHDRQILIEAKEKGGFGATLGAYFRLSGPGWLQSAITLGGGSLASSLYLGILAGYSLMWLQPIAMILGIIMLSAIGYVTMSTGERPFRAINQHVNPVLGWGWAFAVAAANIVWCLPQYSLATGVMTQNLIPALMGSADGEEKDKEDKDGQDAADDSKKGDDDSKKGDDDSKKGDDAAAKDDGKKKDDDGDGQPDADKAVKGGDTSAKSESESAGTGDNETKEDVKLTNASGTDPPADRSVMDWIKENQTKLIIVSVIFVLATLVTWSYDSGGRGIRIYETVLKCMVGLIVICFFGVVIVLSFSEGGLDWNQIFAGLVPNLEQFTKPAATFDEMLGAIQNEAARNYWSELIVSQQRDVMISAAATAVGINMTFLFPYSLLRKGWGPEFRGLAIFDLSTGMFIPYILATGCVVIASAAQFHTKAEGFAIESATAKFDDGTLQGRFDSMVSNREKAAEEQTKKETTKPEDQLPMQLSEPEVKVAAVLVKRDAKHLSSALVPLTGSFVANIIFGVGVLAMTVSTISLLMMISGFVLAEIMNFPPGGKMHKFGTLIAGLAGATGPFVWGGAAAYLAVPTSVFGFVLLPFAYVTFVLLMNQRSFLGDQQPHGVKRLLWNLLMFTAAGIASVGSMYMIWTKGGPYGIAAVVGFILLAIMVDINRKNESAPWNQTT